MKIESKKTHPLIEAHKRLRIKIKQQNDHAGEISIKAREAFKNVILGTAGTEKSLFILGYIAGYLEAEKLKPEIKS